MESYPIPDIEDAIVRLAAELVAIPTVSDNLEDGTQHRAMLRAMTYLERFLTRDGGVDVRIRDYSGRPVLVATVGPQGARKVTYLSHLDIVPTDDLARCELQTRSDSGTEWLYGRGTADMKVAIACLAHVMRQLAHDDRAKARKGVPEDQRIQAQWIITCDEENGSASFRDYLKARGGTSLGEFVVATEPTPDGKVSTQQRGYMRVEYTITGRRAHSAYSHLGANTLTYNALFTNEVTRLDWASQPSSPYPRPVEVEPVFASGGVAPNVIPEETLGELSVRFAAPWTAGAIVQRIGGVAQTITGELPEGCSINLKVTDHRRPLLVPNEHPHVRALVRQRGGGSEAITQQLGSSDLAALPPGIGGVEFGIGKDHHGPYERVARRDIGWYTRALYGYAREVPMLPLVGRS